MPSGGLEDYAPQRVAVLRERAGLSYRQIAVLCSVTIGTARLWETGKLVPGAAKAVQLAQALGVHPADLTNTPREHPTLKQLRQWRGLRGVDAAAAAGIGTVPLYTAETYTSPPSLRVRSALARAYEVAEDQITAAWNRGRHLAYGDLTTATQGQRA